MWVFGILLTPSVGATLVVARTLRNPEDPQFDLIAEKGAVRMSLQDIFNYRLINDKVITAGQPTEAQLHAAANEGVQVVINLAPHHSSNALPDEPGLCQQLGLTYHYIPVDWQNPTIEDYQRFAAALAQTQDQKILIHCAANYRVTAFFSSYAMNKLGWTQEQADTLLNSIWLQDPRYTLNEVWSGFLQSVRPAPPARGEKVGL